MITQSANVEVTAAFQPIVDREFVTVLHEALARPCNGWSPELLAASEPVGLLRAMLELSVDAHSRLGTPVLINVEPSCLNDPANDIVSLFVSMAPVGAVHVELTERGLLDARGTSVLSRLHAEGYNIWLDDFGTEDSTMQGRGELFERGVVTGVKIDKQANPELIAEVLRQHDVFVLQEGVELAEQAKSALARGAVLLQGYLFGRPRQATNAVTSLCVPSIGDSPVRASAVSASAVCASAVCAS